MAQPADDWGIPPPTIWRRQTILLKWCALAVRFTVTNVTSEREFRLRSGRGTAPQARCHRSRKLVLPCGKPTAVPSYVSERSASWLCNDGDPRQAAPLYQAAR